MVLVIIYIPLWLDLLSEIIRKSLISIPHLHSTMVRFIIKLAIPSVYIETHLHSTMVRFIIAKTGARVVPSSVFTFHYG